MNLKNYFSLSRFWLLLKMELFRSRKAVLISFVITFGLLFFGGILLSPVLEAISIFDDHPLHFASNLLIGGFIMSSLAFHDLSSPLRRGTYLLLPVSTLEKFVCMWLLTSVGWILLFTPVYTLYTWLANIVGRMIFSNITFQEFDPTSKLVVMTIRIYFITQGIFLIGAVNFRGYVLPKTLFSIVLFGIVCGTIFYFMLQDMFPLEDDNNDTHALDGTMVHWLWQVMEWLFWWALAPICWLTAYLGLKEQEV
jgi:hypothetical protein